MKKPPRRIQFKVEYIIDDKPVLIQEGYLPEEGLFEDYGNGPNPAKAAKACGSVLAKKLWGTVVMMGYVDHLMEEVNYD